MKKIIALIFCLMVLCMPIVVSAEGENVTTEEVLGDISTLETETPTETSTEAPTETPTETPEDTQPTIEEEAAMLTEQIKVWLLENAEWLGTIITLIATCIVAVRKMAKVDKTSATMNNNAITIAKSSAEAIANALANMEKASGSVTGYDERITALLDAFKITAEDKAKLEAELMEIKDYLKTSSKSNLEFADELAELLSLANIPNYKKEEIGARHVAAKKEILDAEAKAEIKAMSMIPTTTEGVKENVGEEA